MTTTTYSPYSHIGTSILRDRLAQLNRMPLTPSLSAERADIVRELAFRTQN